MRRRLRRAIVAASTAGCVLLTGCTANAPQTQGPSSPEPTTSASPSSLDPYIGYFDTEMPDGALINNTGSFGPAGGVGPYVLNSETLSPGSYAVTVECAGAPEIDVWIAVDPAGGRTTAEPTTELTCPGQVILPAEIAVSALQVVLGSRGETGAFRITVTPS